VTTTSIVALLAVARRDGVGLGSFNVIALEHAEAIVEGAERAGAPVVLQLSQNTVAYHRGLAPLAADYVERTRVDALAVAVGSSHAMLTRDAVLDDALIAALPAAVAQARSAGYADRLTTLGR